MHKIFTLSLVFVCGFSALASASTITLDLERTVALDTAEVYNVVDQMPEIIGGIQEVYSNIEYPRSARLAEVEGRVFIKFIVNEKGKVEQPSVIKDIGSGCGEAAIEGIKKVAFKPGMKDGVPVKVYFTLPVTFKLQS